MCGSGSGPRGNFLDFSVILLNLTKYQLVNKKGLCGPDAHFTLMRVPILIFFIADPEPVCYPDAVVDPEIDPGSQNDADSEPDADPNPQHYLKGTVRPVRSSWEGYPLDRPRLVQNIDSY